MASNVIRYMCSLTIVKQCAENRCHLIRVQFQDCCYRHLGHGVSVDCFDYDRMVPSVIWGPVIASLHRISDNNADEVNEQVPAEITYTKWTDLS
jgi:hypothetical protein